MSALERIGRLEAENTAIRSAMRALVAALPKCDDEDSKCAAVATRGYNEGWQKCDAHGVGREHLSDVAELDYAAPLRAALKLLAELETP